MKKKKKKKRHPLRWFLEYAALRGAIRLFGGLSPSRRIRLSRWLGKVAARWIPIRRRLIEQQIALAFPDWEASRRSELLPSVYEHFIAFNLETLALPRMTRDQIVGGVEMVGCEKFEELLHSGRGFIAVTGHLGNWEWGGAWLAAIGIDVATSAKPIHNPRIDRLMLDQRIKLGAKVFSTKESPRPLVTHLKRGGLLVLIGDQDARRNGIFVPFFGREASTHPGAAWFAYHLDMPLIPMWCYRTEEGGLRVTASEPIRADPDAPAEAEIERLTRYHVAALEEAIRVDPAQYFWVHRRWKTRPKTEKRSADAEVELKQVTESSAEDSE